MFVVLMLLPLAIGGHEHAVRATQRGSIRKVTESNVLGPERDGAPVEQLPLSSRKLTEGTPPARPPPAVTDTATTVTITNAAPLTASFRISITTTIINHHHHHHR